MKLGGVDSVDLIKAQRRKMMQQITQNMLQEKVKKSERQAKLNLIRVEKEFVIEEQDDIEECGSDLGTRSHRSQSAQSLTDSD